MIEKSQKRDTKESILTDMVETVETGGEIQREDTETYVERVVKEHEKVLKSTSQVRPPL